MTLEKGLVYIGEITEMQKIPNAHFIASATVVCGEGGVWKGVVRKNEFSEGDRCLVYLPDSVIPECDEMRFMESRGWRVKMCRFRGAPSEVLIMPMPHSACRLWGMRVGTDVTSDYGVTKYFKPIPANLQGLAKDDFPQFIPKTDEFNYQRHYDLVERLHDLPYYITEKVDGSSTTAYKYKGNFGICSRNLELMPDENNGYWKVAAKYQLEAKLPEGFAVQWETCGPKIQGNPMGLKEIDGFLFNAYNIEEHRHMNMIELIGLSRRLNFPMVKIVDEGHSFDKSTVHLLGEGKYDNGNEREGVVVRSQEIHGYAPISFKVINLNYEK